MPASSHSSRVGKVMCSEEASSRSVSVAAGLQQERLALGSARSVAHEQARAGDRREGHGGLQLRIIVAAGALIGVGPGMVEDILAVGVGFQIAGHAGGDAACGVLQHEMLRQPAGLPRGRSALFQRVKKGMGDEWVAGARCVRSNPRRARRRPTPTPARRRCARPRARSRRLRLLAGRCSISPIGSKARFLRRSWRRRKAARWPCSASLRTVQVSSGKPNTSRAMPGASAGSALIS